MAAVCRCLYERTAELSPPSCMLRPPLTMLGAESVGSAQRQVRNSHLCNMLDQMEQDAQQPPTAPASILLRSTRSLAQ